jgi:SP family sugar:H+ symporter-like MFS transporter
MFVMCVSSIVGVIIEATAKTSAQFIVGRIVLYFVSDLPFVSVSARSPLTFQAVGITENAVPTFQSELVPAGARGAFVASIQFFISIAGLISSGVNKAFSTGTDPRSWIIPTSIQAIFPTIILIGLPFIPLSPRWLISKGRREDAVRVLQKMRPKEETITQACEAEVQAIEEALHHDVDKGSWIELFQGTNRRRTFIAVNTFILQQFTGQAFASQYGPRFYATVGLGAQAFTYGLIMGACGVVACFIGMILIDKLGRRPMVSPHMCLK